MKYDQWTIQSRYPADILKDILKNRKIIDIQDFLNPDYKNLTSTDQLLNIDEACSRINKAVESRESIGLFCDYDADGVTGGAIIYKALQSKKAQIIDYVPERSEGYGLSETAVEFFLDKKIGLLVTVDCGIKNINQIKRLREKGIDCIVIDHHIIDGTLPDAIVVHPHLTKNKKNLELSGGGTAYMLCRHLFKESGQEKWLIDLAAISSVADVVPFNHDNRIIVKYGLTVLAKTKNKGLKSLLEISGLNNKDLTVYDLGFLIAPRLNAAGRVAHPRDSFNLLVRDSNCQEIAKKLNAFNQKRQEMLAQAVQEAIQIVDQTKESEDKAIVLLSDWDEGIVGLIASKICEKYYRPTIVLSNKGKFYKGSARSIENVNITTLISKASKLLFSFGGHAAAAGLSMEKSNYDKFRTLYKKEASHIAQANFVRSLKVDALINPDQLTNANVLALTQLAPFGPGNPKPVLALQSVEIADYEIIGRDRNHKKIYFSCGKEKLSCLLFNFDNFKLSEDIKNLDIAFTVGLNEFRGIKKMELIACDVKENS